MNKLALSMLLLTGSVAGFAQAPSGGGGGGSMGGGSGQSGGGASGTGSTQQQPTMQQPPTAGGDPSMQSGKSASGVAAGDEKFAKMVAQTDVAELAVSKMALEKGSTDQVKKLAQKLIDDHTKTSEAMKEIASKKQIELPTEPDGKHKSLAKKLEAASGPDFDKMYLMSNSKDHKKVVAAFEKEAEKGKDNEIKAFATKFLPAIKEHSEMIDQAMGGATGTK